MKKLIFSTVGIIGFLFLFGDAVFAQGMASGNMMNSDNHTISEEVEGKAVWEKLQAKQITCADVSDDNFATLGEYFMGQIVGNSHEAMNNMIIQMMGEKGEEQMHVVMGKRLSGCDASAAYPAQGVGFLPMMQMMGGMNFRFASIRGFNWIFMILLWILIIVGIITIARWISGQSVRNYEKSSLEILKERYARGEIDRKEFEDKKKDLV